MTEQRDWSDEDIDTLRTMRAEGKSARQIGIAIGRTRNSVIGKLNRLGLCAPMEHGRIRRKVPRKVTCSVAPKKSNVYVFVPPEPIAEEPVFHLDPAAEVDLLSLRPNLCHWPMWTGDVPLDEKRYCGQQRGDHPSYCGFHKKMSESLQPVRKRRRAA